MRSEHDCILTSARTIVDDNPILNCRIKGLEHDSPCKIILDKNLITPTKSRIIKKTKNYNTLIFYNRDNKKKIKILKKHKIKLIKTKLDIDGNFDLRSLLIKIKKIGYPRIFLECGVNLTSKFLSNNLVDDFHLFISNNKIGKNGYNSFKKNMSLFLKNKKNTSKNINLFGDKLISYNIK